MATEKYYFNPPPGTEPFEFLFAGETQTFLPPDQYWKKIREKYIVGYKPVPGVRDTAPDSQRRAPVYRTREVWMLDEEANEKLAKGLVPKPKNFLYLTDAQFRATQYAKFKEQAQHIVSARAMQKEQEDELAALKREHARTLEEHERAAARAEEQVKRYREDAQREAAIERDRIIAQAKADGQAELAKLREEFAAEVVKARAEMEALRKSADSKPPPGPASAHKR